MGFLFGIPRKLIKRVTEIEIDTHYYDTDVVPSSQDIFTFKVDTKTKTAVITGFTEAAKNITTAVMPYRVKYGNDTSELWATVTGIADGAFKNCTNLENITIPNTINTIPSNCFLGCTSLHKVNIPKSIDNINDGAFKNCTNLKTLFIPYGVKNIGENVFENCTQLKILCYKYSDAETYAEDHDIPYSLISYTLDDDITENSPNLVTSGIIYKHITSTIKKITDHINNKLNPHDDSTFSNSTLNDPIINNGQLNGDTNITNATVTVGTLTSLNTIEQEVNGEIIEVVTDDSLINKGYLEDAIENAVNEIKNPSIGVGYQTIYDNSLETTSKTIVGAINEINRGVNTISGILQEGWNTISLNTLYQNGWKFMNKPYCYTDEGIAVDFRIKDYKVSPETIIDNKNTFKIYVPCDCNFTCSTTTHSSTQILSGFPVDYLLLKYYYTGTDGKDLDTVTGINNNNWIGHNTIGWGTSNDSDSINKNGITLIKWGGDNTGGGSSAANTKFYESVYFDISAIQNELPDEDIEVILYATWYSEIGKGNVNVSIECYASDTKPTLSVNNNKLISLSNLTWMDEEHPNPTYSNVDNPISCKVSTKKGNPKDYKNDYTPIFKILFHKSAPDSNYRTIEIQPLS